MGAQRPGLSERSEAPGDRSGGPDDSPGCEPQRATGAVAGEARVVGDIQAEARRGIQHSKLMNPLTASVWPAREPPLANPRSRTPAREPPPANPRPRTPAR